MSGQFSTLRTDVDEFIDLIKKHNKISLVEAAKTLKTPLETVQSWTDFLVEERIIGIEYKFTTPYVFVEEEEEKRLDVTYIGFDTKEEFYDKARKKGISESNTRLLWLKYLNINKETIKQAFYDKAKEKGMPKNKIEVLWQKYLEYLKK